jgi:hypothetical protein
MPKLPLTETNEDGSSRYVCWRCKTYQTSDAFYSNYIQRGQHYCKTCHKAQVFRSVKRRKTEDPAVQALCQLRAAVQYYRRISGKKVTINVDLGDVNAIFHTWKGQPALPSVSQTGSNGRMSLLVLEEPWPDVIEAHHLVPVTRQQYRALQPRKTKAQHGYECDYRNLLHAQLATDATVLARCTQLKEKKQRHLSATKNTLVSNLPLCQT